MKALAGALCAAVIIPLAANASNATTEDDIIQQGYYQSLAARGAGRPDIAEQILRRLVDLQPNAGQLRFDLAVSLAEQGQCATAARAFDVGRRLIRTPSFDRAVEIAMNDLCPGLAPFEVTLGFNIIHDSNANGGAGNSTVIVGGVPLLLSDDAVARQASGYHITGSLAYNYRISSTSYIVPSLSSPLPTTREAISTVSPSLPACIPPPGDRSIGAPARLPSSTTIAMASLVAGSDFPHRPASCLAPRTGLYLNGSHLQINDEANPLRDYNQNSLAATLVHNPAGTNLSLRAGLSWIDRDFTDDFQDIRSTSATIGMSGSLTRQIGYDISYSHRISKGSTPHFLLGMREDMVNTISASASFASLEGWYGRPYLGVSHSISKSTWATKTYDRTKFMAGFTRSF